MNASNLWLIVTSNASVIMRGRTAGSGGTRVAVESTGAPVMGVIMGTGGPVDGSEIRLH